jgi:plasmid stability protein
MIRMQIQLDDRTREALRRRAFAEGKSLSALARQILQQALLPGPADAAPRPMTAKELFPFIGIGKGDAADVAENHDDYLFGDDDP